MSIELNSDEFYNYSMKNYLEIKIEELLKLFKLFFKYWLLLLL